MSVHIMIRVLSLDYVSFQQIRTLASPFPPVGPVAAPCGSPAVPHLHRYYEVVRLLSHPSVLPSVDAPHPVAASSGALHRLALHGQNALAGRGGDGLSDQRTDHRLAA